MDLMTLCSKINILTNIGLAHLPADSPDAMTFCEVRQEISDLLARAAREQAE